MSYDAGRVFTVKAHGTMEAFDAATGALAWSLQLPNQSMFSSPSTAMGGVVYSSPAVSSDGVYVSYGCGQTYDFAPDTGALLWHISTACEGGGGKTPVLANGRVYVRDFQSPVSSTLVRARC